MRKPNVIYILADDMGYGDFGAFNPDVHTPALDRLVEEGCTLEECYSASPVCAPARAGIMTGRYPQRTGVVDTLEARGLDRLNPDETTMADVFRANGYDTGLIGKWHLGAIDPAYHPNNRGFDYFFGFRGGWSDYYQYHIECNRQPVACEGQYLTDVFSEQAVHYIREHRERPFFLHLAYNCPHYPLMAPEAYVDKYRSTGKFTKEVAAIYGMIECMDAGIQKVLNALEEEGLYQDTILIFTSDNGPDLGAESGNSALMRYNCGLRGSKMRVYEGGIKVPAVVVYKGRIAEKSSTAEVVHGIDWLPTLMHMCGLSYPKDLKLDGINVDGAFYGETLPKRSVYWQWSRYRPEKYCNSAVRRGDLKFVHPPVASFLELPQWEYDIDEDIKYHPEKYQDIIDRPVPERILPEAIQEELYNLARDREETNNLVLQCPQQTEELRHSLYAWFEDVDGDGRARTKIKE